MSIEDYDKLLASQNNQCRICGKSQTLQKKRLAVDHDHKTGAIRGLLCNHCNRGLGHFLDSPELLQAAINYLGKVK